MMSKKSPNPNPNPNPNAKTQRFHNLKRPTKKWTWTWRSRKVVEQRKLPARRKLNERLLLRKFRPLLPSEKQPNGNWRSRLHHQIGRASGRERVCQYV